MFSCAVDVGTGDGVFDFTVVVEGVGILGPGNIKAYQIYLLCMFINSIKHL